MLSDERLRLHRVDRREERRQRGEVTLELERRPRRTSRPARSTHRRTRVLPRCRARRPTPPRIRWTHPVTRTGIVHHVPPGVRGNELCSAGSLRREHLERRSCRRSRDEAPAAGRILVADRDLDRSGRHAPGDQLGLQHGGVGRVTQRDHGRREIRVVLYCSSEPSCVRRFAGPNATIADDSTLLQRSRPSPGRSGARRSRWDNSARRPRARCSSLGSARTRSRSGGRPRTRRSRSPRSRPRGS